MNNDTIKRRTIGWITAGVAASAVFAMAGTAATAVTVVDIASAFAKSAATQSGAERAGYSGNGWGGNGGGSQGDGGQSSGSGSSSSATNAQSKGVVVIDTTLSYEGSEAAGTGIVLTSSGEILTNNHVVDGSTSISVTVVSTGKTYTASVVGTDATDDVAVLQLSGASGLATATLDNGSVSVGDDVTAVGNAGGTGTLTAADGTVTGTDKSITTQAEGVVASESLTGLIETDAGIQAGDSGGPLLDAQGEVIGIDTAASASSSVSDGYAIPIGNALDIAKQIESGRASSTITIGLPAFLGVEVASDSSDYGYSGSQGDQGGQGYLGGQGYSGSQGSTTSQAGAAIGGVIDGGPAASAGIVAGDTITAVNGTAIGSSSDLTTTLAQFHPGDSVSVTWTDSAGMSHTASVKLASGPAA
ncbi:PDZ domain-containing protein [Planctomonas sp. JC2975]|uniref:S1C family serine protease n=1 Tax=Planctomonas sp. JC2975 TaxID=2729626 RepID=UPI0014739F2E|nr:trypsin-like peptidase domain-containing protein [Planctomonas sp. JC2975]NNC11963.1 PDZ domain-containing protein [Planctomonas sp. JC2975]